MKKPNSISSIIWQSASLGLVLGMILVSSVRAEEQEELPTEDVIYFKKVKGKEIEPMRGEIIEFGDQKLTLEVIINEEIDARATREIKFSVIESIDFAPEKNEIEILEKADDIPKLGVLWQKKEPYLSMPNSNAGEVGLLYAEAMLAKKNRITTNRCLPIFEQIEKGDWDEGRRIRAQRGKLQAKIRLGFAAEAVEEALALAARSEDPELLIEAKFVLAEAKVAELKKLDEDNPRWEEDDLVAPKRHKLFHEVLDLYYFPYLFFGSEVDPASRGLWKVVELYAYNQDLELAAKAAQDLLALYPESEYSQKVKTIVDIPEPSAKDDGEWEDAQSEKPANAEESPDEKSENESDDEKDEEKSE